MKDRITGLNIGDLHGFKNLKNVFRRLKITSNTLLQLFVGVRVSLKHHKMVKIVLNDIGPGS